MESADGSSPATWREVSGTRSRALARTIEHTDAVHRFLGRMSRQACERGYRVVQFDPPHRASRRFRHRGRLRSIHPDAFGILRRGSETFPFVLEWERRAVRPGTMAARLVPYLRYYSSKQLWTTTASGPWCSSSSTTNWRSPIFTAWPVGRWTAPGWTCLCGFPTRICWKGRDLWERRGATRMCWS